MSRVSSGRGGEALRTARLGAEGVVMENDDGEMFSQLGEPMPRVRGQFGGLLSLASSIFYLRDTLPALFGS